MDNKQPHHPYQRGGGGGGGGRGRTNHKRTHNYHRNGESSRQEQRRNAWKRKLDQQWIKRHENQQLKMQNEMEKLQEEIRRIRQQNQPANNFQQQEDELKKQQEEELRKKQQEEELRKKQQEQLKKQQEEKQLKKQQEMEQEEEQRKKEQEQLKKQQQTDKDLAKSDPASKLEERAPGVGNYNKQASRSVYGDGKNSTQELTVRGNSGSGFAGNAAHVPFAEQTAIPIPDSHLIQLKKSEQNKANNVVINSNREITVNKAAKKPPPKHLHTSDPAAAVLFEDDDDDEEFKEHAILYPEITISELSLHNDRNINEIVIQEHQFEEYDIEEDAAEVLKRQFDGSDELILVSPTAPGKSMSAPGDHGSTQSVLTIKSSVKKTDLHGAVVKKPKKSSPTSTTASAATKKRARSTNDKSEVEQRIEKWNAELKEKLAEWSIELLPDELKSDKGHYVLEFDSVSNHFEFLDKHVTVEQVLDSVFGVFETERDLDEQGNPKILKVGSVFGHFVIDKKKKNEGGIKVYFNKNRSYKIRLHNVIGIYPVDPQKINKVERMYVQPNRMICLGNDTDDDGSLNGLDRGLTSNIRLLYAVPVSKGFREAVAKMIRFNHIGTEYAINTYAKITVTVLTMESMDVKTSSCVGCKASFRFKHDHVNRYEIYNYRIDIEDQSTLFDREKILLPEKLQEIFGHDTAKAAIEKTEILVTNKYVQYNHVFSSTRIRVYTNKSWFCYTDYDFYYKALDEEDTFYAMDWLLITHKLSCGRYYCSRGERSKSRMIVTNPKDMIDHFIEMHFARITSQELIDTVLRYIHEEKQIALRAAQAQPQQPEPDQA